MLAAVPLMLLPVLAYHILAMTLPEGFGSFTAQALLVQQSSAFPTVSGALLSLSIGDMFLIGSLIVLFVEFFRSSGGPKVSAINHSLSMVLFMICVVEFMLVPAFATSAFLLITLMVLMDVLARAAAT